MTELATANTEKLSRLREEHKRLVDFFDTPANKNKIAELKSEISTLEKFVTKKQLEDEQIKQRRSVDELMQTIEALPPKERQHLTEKLMPVIEARRNYLHFVNVTIPADLAEAQRIETERQPLLQSDEDKDREALAELDRKLVDVKKKISGEPKDPPDGWFVGGHLKQREKLGKDFEKAREDFARHY